MKKMKTNNTPVMVDNITKHNNTNNSLLIPQTPKHTMGVEADVKPSHGLGQTCVVHKHFINHHMVFLVRSRNSNKDKYDIWFRVCSWHTANVALSNQSINQCANKVLKIIFLNRKKFETLFNIYAKWFGAVSCPYHFLIMNVGELGSVAFGEGPC